MSKLMFGFLRRKINLITPSPIRPFFYVGARLRLKEGCYQDYEHSGGHGGFKGPQEMEIIETPRKAFNGDTWVECKYPYGRFVDNGEQAYEECYMVNPDQEDFEVI